MLSTHHMQQYLLLLHDEIIPVFHIYVIHKQTFGRVYDKSLALPVVLEYKTIL